MSSILKSPFAASGTPARFVLRWTKLGTFSQMSVAKTLRPAVPPVGVTTSAVPMVLPPANTRPRPSALMRPSTITSALKSAIAHGWPGAWTPRILFRSTTVAVAAVPSPCETGIHKSQGGGRGKISSAKEDARERKVTKSPNCARKSWDPRISM
jgi:hypothetical protein